MGIYRRGQVYWASWVKDQKRHRKSLGTSDRREAEALFERLTSEDSPPSLIFREILRLWLKYQTPRCKPQSVELYKIVRKRFSLVWGDLHPDQITALLVEQFQENSLTAGLSPRTINHRLGMALSAIRWANDRGLIDTEPPKWKPLKVRVNHSRKYLTASELKKLLAKVREPQWERLTPFVMLALYCGCRCDEIRWLEWDDVDLEEGWIHIRPKRGLWSPKSSSSERSIPIAAELADYLTNTPRTCRRWVAPSLTNGQWDRRHLCTKTRQLFKAAGVDDGGPHTLHRLRGTFATSVLRGGGDLESLRQVLGHSALSVTAGYLEATSESKRRAVGGLSFGGS